MKVTTLEQFAELLDTELGLSQWYTLSQQDVAQFADLTHDHNWLHLDADKAKASPFGGTIVHGFLVLSLATRFLFDVIEFPEDWTLVNCGLDKVRFTSPVPVGAKVRGRVSLNNIRTTAHGTRAVFHISAELPDNSKPAAVIEYVVLVAQ